LLPWLKPAQGKRALHKSAAIKRFSLRECHPTFLAKTANLGIFEHALKAMKSGLTLRGGIALPRALEKQIDRRIAAHLMAWTGFCRLGFSQEAEEGTEFLE
jgi:hypothetical protein